MRPKRVYRDPSKRLYIKVRGRKYVLPASVSAKASSKSDTKIINKIINQIAPPPPKPRRKARQARQRPTSSTARAWFPSIGIVSKPNLPALDNFSRILEELKNRLAFEDRLKPEQKVEVEGNQPVIVEEPTKKKERRKDLEEYPPSYKTPAGLNQAGLAVGVPPYESPEEGGIEELTSAIEKKFSPSGISRREAERKELESYQRLKPVKEERFKFTGLSPSAEGYDTDEEGYTKLVFAPRKKQPQPNVEEKREGGRHSRGGFMAPEGSFRTSTGPSPISSKPSSFQSMWYKPKLFETTPKLIKMLGPEGGKRREKALRALNKPLFDSELNSMLLPYRSYAGSTMSDEVEPLLKRMRLEGKQEFGFITNTEPSTKKGEHWQAIYVNTSPRNASFEFYDSFGDKPLPEMMKIFKRFTSEFPWFFKMKINRVKHQSDDSNRCGYHAAKFLMDRFRGIPFAEATKFAKATRKDDECEGGGGETKAKNLEKKFRKFGYI